MSFMNVDAALISIGKNPNIITQAVILAYTGWGYNFYSATNKLRADDLLIRSKISGLLSRASSDLSSICSKLSATLPSPTRQVPFPEPELTATIKAIRKTASEIDALSVKMTALSTPGRDRTWDRHRDQKATLTKLQGFDLYLGQIAYDLQDLIKDISPEQMKAGEVGGVIEAKLGELKAALREREDMLLLG